MTESAAGSQKENAMDKVDLGFGLILSLVLVVVGVVFYALYLDYTVERPKQDAWRAACVAKLGTPIPTSKANCGKGHSCYGDWVCAKLYILPVEGTDGR